MVTATKNGNGKLPNDIAFISHFRLMRVTATMPSSCRLRPPQRRYIPADQNRNNSPTASSSTATCRYADVILTFACPAASSYFSKRAVTA